MGMSYNTKMGMSYNIKYDFELLLKSFNSLDIHTFENDFKAIADKYIKFDFDPDSYFPNMRRFKCLLDEALANLRTVALFSSRGVDHSEYAGNIDTLDKILRDLKRLEWAKIYGWTVSNDVVIYDESGDIIW